MFFGYWATYILPSVTVHIVAPYFKNSGHGNYIIPLTALIWAVNGAGLDLLVGSHTTNNLLKFPTYKDWFTALEFGVIGVVCGTLYWKWFVSGYDNPREDLTGRPAE